MGMSGSTDGLMMMRQWAVVWLLALLVGPVRAQQCPAGPNIAGIVVGTIVATLAVVAIVIAIIFLVRWKRRPKKAKPATKTGDEGLELAHVNPAFQDDTGTTTAEQAKKTNDLSFAEQGFAGYVPCTEFKYTIKETAQSPPRSNGNLATVPLVQKLPHHNFGSKLMKSGSHGSLDDSFPSLAVHSSAIELSKIRSLDPEVINVPLQSQDIIGLGFNICGNLRDGIFVSQVLNRGPASESRLIKPGDRILGITISFENMVYEDALTILSYASPYPVKLQVQKKSLKASDPDVTGDDYEEALHLHHPKYRSQSMDDVSKIAQESVSRMRRAWSEMKRGSSKRKQEDDTVTVEENRLRRWSGQPTSGEPITTTEAEEKSDNSTVSLPDALDGDNLMASVNSNNSQSVDVTVHHEAEPSADHADGTLSGDHVINLDEITLSQTEAPTLGLSPKRQAEADRAEGLRLSYEADRPMRKIDLEETIDLELKTGGIIMSKEEANSEADVELSSELAPEVSTETTDIEFTTSAERNSPSPVILTGDMGLDLKIGAAIESGSASPVMVPDVGEEVAVASEAAGSAVQVTEHDDFLDINITEPKISLTRTDSSSPPPSPPPGPPPEDNVADVTESSMMVLVNEESIIQRDESREEPARGEDKDSVQAMLKDYFSDQPSLMERLGLTKSNSGNDTEEVVLAKRLSSSASKPTGHEPLLEEQKRNSEVLKAAKDAIRRRSTSSEEGVHVSSPSTLSSRSSSPTEQQAVGEEEYEEDVPSERKMKSHSPVAKKKSPGGLSFEISPTDFNEMAVDVPDDALNPSGGVAYFVSIDEQFHGAPLTLSRQVNEEDEKPLLVKAQGGHNMSAHYNLDHLGSDQSSTQVNEVVTIDTRADGPASIITETKTTTVTISNNNNESGVNGKGGDSPIGSPLKTAKEVVTTTEVSKSNTEVITVTRQEEIQGGYMVTVNASSHYDDSEA